MCGRRGHPLALFFALAALIVAAPADWLGEVNRYRLAAGEAAATDYTPAGATEGTSSDLALGSPGVFASDTAAIDS